MPQKRGRVTGDGQSEKTELGSISSVVFWENPRKGKDRGSTIPVGIEKGVG